MNSKVSITRTLAFGAVVLLIGLAGTSTAQAVTDANIDMVHALPEWERERYTTSPQVDGLSKKIYFTSGLEGIIGADVNGVRDVYFANVNGSRPGIASYTDDEQLGNDDSFDGSARGDNERVVFTSLATNMIASDTNGFADVFLRNPRGRTTVRISESGGIGGDGHSFDPMYSEDGNYIVFTSAATNLDPFDTDAVLDVYLYNVQADTLEVISRIPGGAKGNGDSYAASISGDGNDIVFVSKADNLGAGSDLNSDSDIFWLDRAAGTLMRVSSDAAGNAGDDFSVAAQISENGRIIAFVSKASNLVLVDTNGFADVFTYDTVAGTTTLISGGYDGSGANADAAYVRPELHKSGTSVVYTSEASNLTADDDNVIADAFLYSVMSGTTERISIDLANEMFDQDVYWFDESEGMGDFLIQEQTVGADLATAFVADISGKKDLVIGGIAPYGDPGNGFVASDFGFEVLAENVLWASPNGHDLHYTMYHPDGITVSPVIVFTKGGAWAQRYPDIVGPVVQVFTDAGYAVAVGQKRDRTVANFPDQLHDYNGFIRFVRANAAQYPIDTTNIVSVGSSSGGVLAAIEGFSEGDTGLEGDVGGNLGVSSDTVATIIIEGSYVLNQLDNIIPSGLSAFKEAIGCPFTDPCDGPGELEILAADYYFDTGDNPVFILHGEDDTTLPITQAEELDAILTAAGHAHEYHPVPGVGHSNRLLIEAKAIEIVDFLNLYAPLL